MLHAAMDALIKDLNANEAARLLILLDDRLTTLINGAEIDREAKPARVGPAEPRPAEPLPAMAEPAVAAEVAPQPPARAPEPVRPTPSPARMDPPAKPASAVAPPAPPQASPPVEQAEPEPPAPAPIPATDIPSAPIMVVPQPAEPAPVKTPPAAPAFPSFEDMIASTARAKVEAKPDPVAEAPPPPKAGTVATAVQPDTAALVSESAPSPSKSEPAVIGPVQVVPKPAVSAPVALPPPSAKPVAPPAASVPRPQEAPAPALDDEPADADDDFIEEDFEDGEDLVEAAEAVEKKPGLAGRFLSKFRLPGLGRRAAPVEPVDEAEAEGDDEAEAEDEATPPPAAPALNPVRDLSLRRLYAAVDQLPVEALLAEAEQRTGNRIELRKVEDGIELVVKGLPTALGSVRLSSEDGHVVYHPRFGLDLPHREPNRADLELWTKAMGDLVVRVLEDIAERRKARLAQEPGSKAS